MRRISSLIKAHRVGIWFSVSQTGLSLTQMTGYLISCRFILPEDMGIWQTAMLVNIYAGFFNLGILSGLGREFPYLMGKNKRVKAIEYSATALVHMLFVSVILMLCFVCFTFWHWSHGVNWRMGGGAMSLTAPLLVLCGYYKCLYRSGNEFSKLAWLFVGLSFLNLLTILFPWFFGFRGFLGRELLLSFVQLAMLHFNCPIHKLDKPSWACWRELFDVGWRIYINSYIVQIIWALPRTMLRLLGSTALLGSYAPVNWMFSGLRTLTAGVSMYVYPQLTYRFASTGKPVKRIAALASLLMMLFFAPVIIFGVLLLPWAIKTCLPNYIQAVTACQISLVAAWLEVFFVTNLSLATQKRWCAMYTQLAFHFVIRLACCMGGFFLMRDKLTGIACGNLAASMCMIPVVFVTIFRSD